MAQPKNQPETAKSAPADVAANESAILAKVDALEKENKDLREKLAEAANKIGNVEILNQQVKNLTELKERQAEVIKRLESTQVVIGDSEEISKLAAQKRRQGLSEEQALAVARQQVREDAERAAKKTSQG